ncbi:MAG: flagellar motor switch protein FliN [Planctomycetaceae bacterium]|nr:flagellar motor switch protein FliN [Planctomycetaceae bacterium]
MADSDDLLSPDEIEALMQAARGGALPPGPAPAANTPAESHLLDASEIDALMAQAQPPRPSRPPKKMPSAADVLSSADIDALINGGGGISAQPEQTLRQAQRQLDRAMAPDPPRGPKSPRPELGDPQPFGFPDFGPKSAQNTTAVFPIAALEDVELDLRIELGRTELLIEEVLQLREGTVVPLDKLAGDPVDILVNGRLIARGEVLVLNDNFCVRVAEILTPEF